jgi:hypothetical protein
MPIDRHSSTRPGMLTLVELYRFLQVYVPLDPDIEGQSGGQALCPQDIGFPGTGHVIAGKSYTLDTLM